MPRITRQIHVGTVAIGGNAPVAVQSMTNTDSRDSGATLAQIERLAAVGCEIVRCAVPDQQAAAALAAGGEAVGKDCYENIDSRCASPVHSAIFMEGAKLRFMTANTIGYGVLS